MAARVSCPTRNIVDSVIPTAGCEPAKKSLATANVDVRGISARAKIVKLSQCKRFFEKNDEAARLRGKANTTSGKKIKAAPRPRFSPPGPRKTVVAPKFTAMMRSARVDVKTKQAIRTIAFQSWALFIWSRSIAARRSAADSGSENTGWSIAECRMLLCGVRAERICREYREEMDRQRLSTAKCLLFLCFYVIKRL